CRCRARQVSSIFHLVWPAAWLDSREGMTDSERPDSRTRIGNERGEGERRLLVHLPMGHSEFLAGATPAVVDDDHRAVRRPADRKRIRRRAGSVAGPQPLCRQLRWHAWRNRGYWALGGGGCRGGLEGVREGTGGHMGTR